MNKMQISKKFSITADGTTVEVDCHFDFESRHGSYNILSDRKPWIKIHTSEGDRHFPVLGVGLSGKRTPDGQYLENVTFRDWSFPASLLHPDIAAFVSECMEAIKREDAAVRATQPNVIKDSKGNLWIKCDPAPEK